MKNKSEIWPVLVFFQGRLKIGLFVGLFSLPLCWLALTIGLRLWWSGTGLFQPVFLTQSLDFRMCCLSCVCMPTSTLTLKRIVAVGLSQNSSPNIMSWIPSISPLPPLSNGSCLMSCGCELSETSWKIVNDVWSYVLDILEKESLCIFLGRKYSAYANCCWLLFHSISFICFLFTAT